MGGIRSLGNFRGLPFRAALALATVAAVANLALAQQMSPDERAAMVLNSARTAFNENNYPVAIERFQAFLKDFSKHDEAAAARLGLAMALLRSASPDYAAAQDALSPIADRPGNANPADVHYHLAVAQRGLGDALLEKSSDTPGDDARARSQANRLFEQAARRFASAAASYGENRERADTARCDQAEVLIRLGRFADAIAAITPISDSTTNASAPPAQAQRALYLHGYASFGQKDYLTAGRMLSRLAPFEQNDFAGHARYLLARAHHLAEEHPEAAAGYEAVIKWYTHQKSAAADALKKPDQFKEKPREKAELEAIVKQSTPDYVARALFHWGEVLCNNNQFSDAAGKFSAFIQQHPQSILLNEARLRLGICQVNLKQYGEAPKTLSAVHDDPMLADQALLWTARVQLAAADPNNAKALEQSRNSALDLLKRAVERAKSLPNNPASRLRVAEVNMQLGEVQQQLTLFSDAAATFAALANPANYPQHAEDALLRQIIALQSAGQTKQSDEAVVRFQKLFPESPLLAEVLFRYAETPYLLAGKTTGDGKRALYADAVNRYEKFISDYPDAEQVNLARQAIGMALYATEDYAKAAKTFAGIPEAERSGPLTTVPYFLADCIIRQLPDEAPDALSSARLSLQLQNAVTLLTTFLNLNLETPEAADALLKIGYCHQRSAALLVDEPERNKALTEARQAYMRIIRQYAKSPLVPVAIYESAKVMADLRDRGSAVRELQRFRSEPLKSAPIAPLAMVRLAQFMCDENRPAEAATLLAETRSQSEAQLLQDPQRRAFVPAIQLAHAMCLSRAGKLAEAHQLLQTVIATYPDSPESADAKWQLVLCEQAQAIESLESAEKALSQAKPDERQSLQSKADSAAAALQQFAADLASRAAAAGDNADIPEQQKLLYQAVQCNRRLAESQIRQQQAILQQQSVASFAQRVKQNPPTTRPAPNGAEARPPQITLAQVPLQPAEKAYRQQYRQIIDVDPYNPAANNARFELAEAFADRDETDAAIELLTEAIDNDPPANLADRMRIRLGACQLARGDGRAAQRHFDAVTAGGNRELLAYATCGAGEAFMLQKKWSEAVDRLARFRETPQIRMLPGISDRALLKLGEAHAAMKQWDPSRQANELLVQRFPRSPFVHDARYGIGLAWQSQKQFDNAIKAYELVVKGTAAEVAARAQIQIGLCRFDQGRPADAAAALMVVPFTYDYPELSASAMCEAARAYIALQQPDEATRLLKHVLAEHPDGPLAQLARTRLEQIK